MHRIKYWFTSGIDYAKTSLIKMIRRTEEYPEPSFTIAVDNECIVKRTSDLRISDLKATEIKVESEINY